MYDPPEAVVTVDMNLDLVMRELVNRTAMGCWWWLREETLVERQKALSGSTALN